MRESHNLLKGQFFTSSHVWHWHVRVGPLCNLIRDGRPQKGLHTEQGGRQKKCPWRWRSPEFRPSAWARARACMAGAHWGLRRPGQFLLQGLATPSASVSPSTWLRSEQVERNMAAGRRPNVGRGGDSERSRRVDSAGGLKRSGALGRSSLALKS